MAYLTFVSGVHVWIFVLEGLGWAKSPSGIHGRMKERHASWHVYHPIRCFLNDSKSAFFNHEDVSSLILSWDGKDLDTVLAFTEMRVEPVVFDVPVLVSCSKAGRISHCNI